MTGNARAAESGQERYDPWEVTAYFHLLSEEYRAGEANLPALRSTLEGLLFRDGDGSLWTVGVKSGKWYLRAGDGWVSARPNGPLSLARRHAAPAVAPGASAREWGAPAAYCPACGSAVGEDARFCGGCGQALDDGPLSNNAATGKALRQHFCLQCGGALRPNIAFCEHCGARLLPQDHAGTTAQALPPRTAVRPRSGVWWLLPILFAWLGGIIAWLAVKGSDTARARKMLWLGVWMTFVWSAVAITLLSLLDSDLLDLI